MKFINKIIYVLVFCCAYTISVAETNNLKELIEILQKDLKTLEKAVYSESLISENLNDNFDSNSNGEEVLTKHLLKLSDIERQFKELTNKFEEINFKLDKLSNRLTKIQPHNQYRIQNL